MANTVGQFQQSAFTSPAFGDSPISSSVVRGNDNSVAGKHNSHDADYTIHVQQSAVGSRPAAGTAGRIWFASDTYELAYDTGAAWQSVKVTAANVTAGTFPAGTYTFTGDVVVGGSLQGSGTLTISGAAQFDGNVTFGNATTDTVSFTSRVASDVLPSTATTRDLGSAALAFREAYVRSVRTTYLGVGTDGAVGNQTFVSDGNAALGSADTLLIGYNTTARVRFTGLNSASPLLAPYTDNQGLLGNASFRWNSLRVGTGSSQFDGTLAVTGLITATAGVKSEKASLGVYDGSLIVQSTTDGDVYRLGMGRASFYQGNVVVGRDGGAGSTGSYLAIEVRDTLGSVNEVARWSELGQLQLQPRAAGTVALTVSANASTATTVGAAGVASALPANPVGYLRITIAGTVRKIPYYTD